MCPLFPKIFCGPELPWLNHNVVDCPKLPISRNREFRRIENSFNQSYLLLIEVHLIRILRISGTWQNDQCVQFNRLWVIPMSHHDPYDVINKWLILVYDSLFHSIDIWEYHGQRTISLLKSYLTSDWLKFNLIDSDWSNSKWPIPIGQNWFTWWLYYCIS